MRRLYELHGIHGPDIRGVRPYQVILLVWFANLVGATTLMVDYLLVLPFPDDVSTPDVERTNILLGLACVAASWIVLGFIATPRTKHALDWTLRGSPPDAEEREATLALPWWLFWMQVVTWVVSTVIFFVANLHVSVNYSVQVSGAVIISGLATAATAYLLCLRLFRSATARVLELSPPTRDRLGTGVGERAMFIWALTTGVPVLGLVLMVAFANESGVSLEKLSLSGLVIGLGALITGLFANLLFAKSVGEPLCELTEALAAIEDGDLSVHVTVDDPGEIGRLQAGINSMVRALNEREQLRDLFGRHVGEDVARLALAQGVALGGEERECAALFVDVIGSTTFAATRSPGEVVAALNRFFEVVVSVVSEHGGLVNKFEGDAALCIF
ncbi:MAG: adenylate/guanylate cyclase domain-containing protein, partial [Microbacterium sp.]